MISKRGNKVLLHRQAHGLLQNWSNTRCLWASFIFVLMVAGCSSPLMKNLEAYQTAKKSGNYELAGQYISQEARIWFDKKEGLGHPMSAKGGPYKHWDKEFKSSSIKKKIRVRGNTVSYISYENNDYFRLIERTPGPARVTYYFNDERKITGMLYKGLSFMKDRPPDRRCEFDRWAATKYPGLLESDEMKIPNNPKRWRELLTE